MNGDRVRIDEAWRHEQSDGSAFGKLVYAPDGRRSAYLISRRVRGGWRACRWQRWVPVTHHPVRPAGYFGRRSDTLTK